MALRGDRRGQSVVVGTVILFGFLVLALSLYQVQVVPGENSGVEFDHSQQVEGEFLDLRNAVLSASRVGEGRSTSLKLGTRYPQRTFSLNPPPASGDLSTTEPRELRVENVTVDADGNVETYWDNRTGAGDAIGFDTRSIRFSPGYNELRNGPDLVYEHSLVVAEFESAALGRSGQTAVDSDRNRIRLTALDGDVDESGVERTSLDPETLSQTRRSVRLNATGGDPIVLELPTDVSAERADGLETQWRDRLGVDAERVTVANGTVRIALNGTQSYRLELGKVGLGTGASAPNESTGYIKRVSAGDRVAVAEVRDRFNNPVEGAAVTVFVDGSEVRTDRTDEDGRVSYEASGGSSDVEFVTNDDSETWESVRFESLGGASGGGGGGSGAGQSGDSQWDEGNTTETVSSTGGVWSGIDNVNAVVLSDLRLTPIKPSDGSSAPETRYFRIAVTVGDPPDGERRFTFVVPSSQNGAKYTWNSAEGRFEASGSFTVVLYDERNGTSSVVSRSADIRQDSLQALLDGGEVDLLDQSNYVDPGQSFVDKLDQVRSHLEGNTSQEAYISDVDGRVNLTLENRSETMADQTRFVTGSGQTDAADDSIVLFDVENTGSSPSEIIEVAVNSTTDNNADIVRNDNTNTFEGAVGAYDGEITIGGPSEPLDTDAEIASGATETFTLGQFRQDNPGNDPTRGMEGDTVTVTVFFSDGSQLTFTLTA